MGTDFESWFAKQEFWKENSARERIQKVWDRLQVLGVDESEIAGLLDEIVDHMRDEYGD